MPSYVKRYVRKGRSERREEIIDATLALIGEHGVEGATVARITAAVGLTPGALYRHFESRAALIGEANRVASKRALSWLDMSDEPDILRRLEELGKTHAAWATDNFNTIVRSFFLELGSAQRPDLADHLNLATIKPYQALVDLAEEGKRQGSIRADVRAEDVAWAVLMCAWTEDIARLVGGEQAVADGTFARNLKRLLDSFRVDAGRMDAGRTDA